MLLQARFRIRMMKLAQLLAHLFLTVAEVACWRGNTAARELDGWAFVDVEV